MCEWCANGHLGDFPMTKTGKPPKNTGAVLASDIAKLAAEMVPIPVISPFRETQAKREKTVGAEVIAAEKAIARIYKAAGHIQQENPETLPYGISAPEVHRMASQLMSFEQIAGVFSLPVAVFTDCLKRFPTLRHAYETGAANMIDRATAVIRAAVELGDTATARFVLERKGGWEAKQQAPVVIMAAPMAQIDGAHVSELASMQRAIRDAPDAEMA